MSIWRVKPVSAFEADMKKNDLKNGFWIFGNKGKWNKIPNGAINETGDYPIEYRIRKINDDDYELDIKIDKYKESNIKIKRRFDEFMLTQKAYPFIKNVFIVTEFISAFPERSFKASLASFFASKSTCGSLTPVNFGGTIVFTLVSFLAAKPS